MADTSIKMVQKMFFLIFFNIDIRFAKEEITWKRYAAAKTLLITKKIELLCKKTFMAAVLNADNKTFVMHIAVLNIQETNISIYPY